MVVIQRYVLNIREIRVIVFNFGPSDYIYIYTLPARWQIQESSTSKYDSVIYYIILNYLFHRDISQLLEQSQLKRPYSSVHYFLRGSCSNII